MGTADKRIAPSVSRRRAPRAARQVDSGSTNAARLRVRAIRFFPLSSLVARALTLASQDCGDAKTIGLISLSAARERRNPRLQHRCTMAARLHRIREASGLPELAIMPGRRRVDQR